MIGPDDVAPRPRPSATAAIQPAIDWTRWVLFTDGTASKWFILGFCSFLASLGQGGGGGGGGGNQSGSGGPSQEPSIRPLLDWLANNVGLVVLIAIAGLIFIVVIVVLITWLGSRGKFMFFDGVVQNRGAVREPWRRFVYLGNSLCGFRLVLALGMMLVTSGMIVLAAFIAWPDIEAERFGSSATLALGITAIVMLPLGLSVGLVSLILEDFIVPIMYLRNVRTTDAFSIFFTEIGSSHIGAIIFFYLLKIVLTLMTFAIILAGVCVTCFLAGCLMLIPYIGSVFLLPFSVFFRAYSIFFIQQFGQEWQFIEHQGE